MIFLYIILSIIGYINLIYLVYLHDYSKRNYTEYEYITIEIIALILAIELSISNFLINFL